MQHCCIVIMLGLWLSWRLALSQQTPVRKPKCMKSCSHYCSFLNVTPRPPCFENNPHSLWRFRTNEKQTMQPSCFWLSADVPVIYIYSWIRECMKWWGVRLHALLWSERYEFKGPTAALSQLIKPLTPYHLTAWWFIHNPTSVEGVNVWLPGYCRLEQTEHKQSETQT